MAKKRRQFAKDVSRHWEKAVQNAKYSLTIFTPFFDPALCGLLNESALPKAEIKLITDCSAVRLIESPAQLRTLKTLIDQGVQVKQLSRLHAKVLVADEETIFLGSQNFTRAGKKNREATARFESRQVDEKFVEKLNQWADEAETIDPKWIELLLSEMNPLQKEHEKLVGKAEDAEKNAREKFEKAEKEKRNKHFDRIIGKSALQLSDKWVWAHVEMINYDYRTLLLDSEGSMVHWVNQNQDGGKVQRLPRLNMFPALITENMRMAFARVCGTRITYFRNKVDWSSRYKLEGRSFRVSVSFPKTDTKRRNITITLRPPWANGFCRLDCRFDGQAIQFKKSHIAWLLMLVRIAQI